MQNFFSNMMPGSTQGTGGPNDDVPWWMRYGAKMLGCVGGGGKNGFPSHNVELLHGYDFHTFKCYKRLKSYVI